MHDALPRVVNDFDLDLQESGRTNLVAVLVL